MKDKEIQETVTRLKAYAECFRRKTRYTSTSIDDCNKDLCDGCTLLYAQGTAGEHLKDIETVIRLLEKEPCEDAVSRQRVIEELRYMDNNGFITRSVNHVVDDIRSIPSVKPLDNQLQWIPVSERLPKEEGYYLVTLDCRIDGVSVTFLWFHGNNTGWESCAYSVIAWMPLPPSYQGEENG